MPAGGGFGGGIEDNSSGALTVTNSTFDDNEAIAVGPNDPIVSPSYIFAAGGAIDLNLASTGSATISNSTFSGNEAQGGSPGASAGGGAISNSSNVGATLTVTGCTLKDNEALRCGRRGRHNQLWLRPGGRHQQYRHLDR